jgi:hypothetical protein
MADSNNSDASFLRRALGVFGYSRRALELVWTTSKALTITLGLLTLIGGVLPAVIAYIGHSSSSTVSWPPHRRANRILKGYCCW